MERLDRRSLLFAALLSLLILGNLFLLAELNPLIQKVFSFLKTVLFPFFMALIISYVLNPLVTMISGRNVPRSVAVTLIYAVFFVSLTVILMNVIPILGKQLRELAAHLPEWNERLQAYMHKLGDGKRALPYSVQDSIDGSLDKIEKSLSHGMEHALLGLKEVIQTLLLWLFIPFVVFYMLKDFKAMERSIVLFLPKSNRRRWIRLFRDVDEALGHYIRGQLLVCLVVGVLAYTGYMMIGLDYALLLASIVALTNIIPFIGPIIGAAPAVLIGLSESWKLALFALTVNVFVQFIESNIVSPQIVGRSLNIHPLVIIFALLVGGQTGGLLGLILAVPAVAVGKVILAHLVRHKAG